MTQWKSLIFQVHRRNDKNGSILVTKNATILLVLLEIAPNFVQMFIMDRWK